MAVIGIDLGTTNSVVAAVVGSEVQIVTDPQQRRLHPSVISFQPDGMRVFSHEAVARRIIDPKYTIYSAKRLLGQAYRSEEVQLVASRVPYDVREGPNEQPVFCGPNRTFTMPEISGMMLSYLKQISEMYLGDTVDGAVITVPANFNETQRRATMDAGRIAGIDGLRVLNEPTAAALAYGRGRTMSQRIAVYDFGGGTFDVTILQIEGEVFEVLATGGDTFLGGDDADSVLMNVLGELYLAQHGSDPREDQASRARLMLAAEQIKRHLSDYPEAKGEFKAIGHSAAGLPQSLRFAVGRPVFERAITSLVNRTIKTCDEVLAIAQLAPMQIDEVILVGGSTRIPLVRQMVEKHFGRPPRTDINPDEVVGFGAAIQADQLANGPNVSSPQAVLLDVTPRGLGIAVAGGFSEMIIEKNVQVPIEQTRLFTTSADNQTVVRIRVCEGESKRYDENTALGELELPGLPPALRGEVKIEVTFHIDASGILRVKARDPDADRATEAAVNLRGGMSEAEVADATARNAEEMSHTLLPESLR